MASPNIIYLKVDGGWCDEPSPNRCRFDEVFSNKTKNAVSCSAVIDIQELNRTTVIICADLSKSKL